MSALYSETPVLSNLFYAVRLRVDENIRKLAEKALVLWLNSIWGLLTLLINREETRGLFTSLQMSQWKILPVLNVRELNEGTVRCLVNAFDKYANADFGRLTEQFERGTRMEMDVDVIKCLSTSSISADKEGTLRSELKELYARFGIALRQVLGRK